MRSVLLSVLIAVSGAWAKPQKNKAPEPKPTKAKVEVKSTKSSPPARPAAKDPDAVCQDAWSKGDLATMKRRCAQVGASESATNLYWKSLLATDPSQLRKNLSATRLKELDSLDSRLLLLAGRYQFSVGEVRELNDLAWLAAKRKLKDARIDTLRKLAKGQ